MNIKQRLYFLISNVSLGAFLALAYGFSPILLGKFIILSSTNIFALPFIFIWKFPLWIWYILTLHWIGQILLIYKWEIKNEGT